MKKMLIGVMIIFSFFPSIDTNASSIIENDIYVNEINIGGLTEVEAKQEVYQYVEKLKMEEISFVFANDEIVVKTLADFDLVWTNPNIISEAAAISQSNNIVQKYKVKEYIANEKPVFNIEFGLDVEVFKEFLDLEGTPFDVGVLNVGMNIVNGEIEIIGGDPGYALDVEESVKFLLVYLSSDWSHKAEAIPMVINEIEPLGSKEELSQLTEILGTYTTSYTSSSAGRSANVARAAELINGTIVYLGEVFSIQDAISPVTIANGYHMGGSYVQGQLVDSIGGGVCQVSSTLYNATLLAELEIVERHNHSMVVSYVPRAMDAAIASSAGKDFRFMNNSETPVYIEAITVGKKLTFNFYGVETRPENRKVTYESEVTEVIPVDSTVIHADAGQGLGYIVTQSGYTGYKSKLWKVVTIDGVVESKELVNSSNYAMSPGSATVGVATSDPNQYNEVMAAISTNNLDHVRNIVAALLATPAVEG